MPRFKVRFEEISTFEVTVTAATQEEAEERVRSGVAPLQPVLLVAVNERTVLPRSEYPQEEL